MKQQLFFRTFLFKKLKLIANGITGINIPFALYVRQHGVQHLKRWAQNWSDSLHTLKTILHFSIIFFGTFTKFCSKVFRKGNFFYYWHGSFAEWFYLYFLLLHVIQYRNSRLNIMFLQMNGFWGEEYFSMVHLGFN